MKRANFVDAVRQQKGQMGILAAGYMGALVKSPVLRQDVRGGALSRR